MNQPESFNLSLPVYTGTPRERRWMTDAESAVYDAWEESRKAALLALVRAISPELVKPTPHSGSWREAFSFTLTDAYRPTLAFAFIKSGQLQITLENSGYSKTFRRIGIDKAGTIDARIVAGVRELVAKGLEMAEHDKESAKRAAVAASERTDAFAHACEVVKANGLGWADAPYKERGVVKVPGYGYSALIVDGGTLKLDLSHIPVDKLPIVLAFLKEIAP